MCCIQNTPNNASLHVGNQTPLTQWVGTSYILEDTKTPQIIKGCNYLQKLYTSFQPPKPIFFSEYAWRACLSAKNIPAQNIQEPNNNDAIALTSYHYWTIYHLSRTLFQYLAIASHLILDCVTKWLLFGLNTHKSRSERYSYPPCFQWMYSIVAVNYRACRSITVRLSHSIPSFGPKKETKFVMKKLKTLKKKNSHQRRLWPGFGSWLGLRLELTWGIEVVWGRCTAHWKLWSGCIVDIWPSERRDNPPVNVKV